MSSFAVRNPHFIVVICLAVALVGGVALIRMPVDMFPPIGIPVVVVATFFNGMPPEQIEADITSRMERFITLASNIEHIESRSLPGVSLIKVYFQPGADADAAVTSISNLAVANLRRLPAGTLPPVTLKFDASSLPVCLITLRGEGLSETALRDAGQYTVRNQVAGVPGASVPQPFGGKYRQIMVYVDPQKLEAHQLSPMDVVRSVNEANLILPSGDVRLGRNSYNVYTNSQIEDVEEINDVPLKTTTEGIVKVSDIGRVMDAAQIQVNVVRIDGQKSVYLPVLKQGGDSNTIAIVDGVRKAVSSLVDVPQSLTASVVFDQSLFVKRAITNLVHEGAIGIFLTSAMILVFLGSFRATLATLLSIPLSALATFLVLSAFGSTINVMMLGGLALAFSRLIDNSVVVLENIYRHLEMGLDPQEAAERGGREVALPVFAATMTTAVVFFPVTFLYGVSRFLFTAMALAVVVSLFASYVVALTVVPLYSARLLKSHAVAAAAHPLAIGERFHYWFNRRFDRLLDSYGRLLAAVLRRPVLVCTALLACVAASLGLYPLLGISFFPRTDSGQFVIQLKAPTGTRIEVTEGEVEAVENIVRRVVRQADLDKIVSNIGVQPGFSALYTTNSGPHTAFVQVSLTERRSRTSHDYMRDVQREIRRELPDLRSFAQSGGLVDAVLNLGLAAPIDVQVIGSDLNKSHEIATELSHRIIQIPGVTGAFVPQDVDYPALRLRVDRTRAGVMGLSQREVVQNVITALSSNQMIAPTFWVDHKSGNDYFLTVQYPEGQIERMNDLVSIPIRGPRSTQTARLAAVSSLERLKAASQVDHYQLRRVVDVYVGLESEDLGRVASEVEAAIASMSIPSNVRIELRGMVQGMRASFRSFALGMTLALMLLYFILVAQFRSWVDPLIILLAFPPGLMGVIFTLLACGTTLNVMSLMGLVMLAGVAVSNSILLVEFTNSLRRDGMTLREALIGAARTRLRPILMTSLATIIGLIPMALKLGAGSESYAPLAQAIIGGLSMSVLITGFLVPAAYLIVYRGRREEVLA